jgi:hypothetical protein
MGRPRDRKAKAAGRRFHFGGLCRMGEANGPFPGLRLSQVSWVYLTPSIEMSILAFEIPS